MKKILATILASSMLISLPFSNVLAEDLTQDSTSGHVQLNANVASTYTVKLPTSADVAATSSTFAIQAKGDVARDKQITISEGNAGKNKLEDSADNTHLIDINFSVDKAFIGKNLEADYTDANTVTVTITHDALSAGIYTCNLPITISLDNIEV